MKEENTFIQSQKPLSRQQEVNTKRLMVWGGNGVHFSMHFNLPSVRGSAKSTAPTWHTTGKIILEVEVLSSVDLILQNTRAILISHNTVMDARAGTSGHSMAMAKNKREKAF